MRPLDGITVDLRSSTRSRRRSAPRQLADLGARVIKIERPGGGDFARALRRARPRPGVALRLGEPLEGEPDARPQAAGGAGTYSRSCIARRRRAGAEPRARARRRGSGLSYADARVASIRGSIVCDISGYGADGPYRDKKAYDLLIQSEAGFLSVTGDARPSRRRPAARSPTSRPACTRITGILAALHPARQDRRRARRIDVSMLETLVEWMSYPLYYAFERRQRRRRAPAQRTRRSIRTARSAAGDGKDGRCSACRTSASGPAFCADVLAVGLAADPRLSGNSRRRREPRRAEEGDHRGNLSPADRVPEVVARLDAAQIANAGQRHG